MVCINCRLGKINSVAIVEDSGGYSGVLVAAHEIAHLLGVVHDGDYAPVYLSGPGASFCSWYDGYIMSDRRKDYRGHQWSSCSIQQLKYFFNSGHGSCLYNYPSSSITFPGAGSLPGQDISLDSQCFKDQGTRACHHDYRVCSQLFCYNPSYTSCLSYRPAVDGSPCGSGMICRQGSCVSNSFNSYSFRSRKVLLTSNKLTRNLSP